jgi:hypothetical protein
MNNFQCCILHMMRFVFFLYQEGVELTNEEVREPMGVHKRVRTVHRLYKVKA